MLLKLNLEIDLSVNSGLQLSLTAAKNPRGNTALQIAIQCLIVTDGECTLLSIIIIIMVMFAVVLFLEHRALVFISG